MRLFLAETLPGTQNDLGGVLDEKNRISKLFWRHTFFGGDTGNNPSKHDLETFYRFDWLITKFSYIFRLGIYIYYLVALYTVYIYISAQTHWIQLFFGPIV